MISENFLKKMGMLIPVRAEEPPQVWMDRQKNLSPQKKETEASFPLTYKPT